MEMFNITAMVNIFLSVVAFGLLVGGFNRYSDIPAYKKLGVGFAITYLLIILVQTHTLLFPGAVEWYLKLSTTAWCVTGILFYFLIFKHKKQNKMSNKNVAFFNEDPNDEFVSYLIDSTTTVTVGIKVNMLPTSVGASNTWFQASDVNGVIDACAEIDQDSTAVGKFRRDSDGTIYTTDSQDFIGGKPPVRPGF